MNALSQRSLTQSILPRSQELEQLLSKQAVDYKLYSMLLLAFAVNTMLDHRQSSVKSFISGEETLVIIFGLL